MSVSVLIEGLPFTTDGTAVWGESVRLRQQTV
jgi:hypothetical protein